MRLAIGIDPGKSASVALVAKGAAARPVLLGVWSIYGADAPWRVRAEEAISNAAAAMPEGAGLAGTFVEVPAARGRTRGEKFGPDVWLGLGQRIGWLSCLAHGAGLGPLVQVPSGDWPKALGLRKGKQGDGQHRIGEAAMHCDTGAWRRTLLMGTAASTERAICQAESILIAAAALL